MALKTKIKSLPKVKAEKPVELTLEQIRDKHQIGSFELAVAELKELLRVADIAREAGNAGNRQQTVAKKALKAYMEAAQLKPEDELQIGDIGFRYDVSYADKINARALYDMVKKQKITEEQFLSVINVAKGPAGHLIGAHVLASITSQEAGKEFDIRKSELSVPAPEPRVERKSTPPKAKGKLNKAVEQAPGKLGGAAKLKKVRRIKV